VDDNGTSGSDIDAAEYYVDTEGDPGSGTAMNAVDGFDSATEDVTASVDVEMRTTAPCTSRPAARSTGCG